MFLTTLPFLIDYLLLAHSEKISTRLPPFLSSARRFPQGRLSWIAQELAGKAKYFCGLGTTRSEIETCKPSFTIPEQGEVSGIQFILFQIKAFQLPHVGALLHNSGRVTDRSQSCLNAIEFALTQACPGLTYDSVPHI